MKLGKSSNPTLSDRLFSQANTELLSNQGTMTLQGTINKTALMLLLVVVSASYTWQMATTNPAAVSGWMIGGAIGGFILAMVTIFKQSWSPYTAPLYALVEGLFLGAISAFFNAMYPGIVMQAVGLTFSIFLVLLLLYKTGMVQATPKFKRGIIIATGGVFVFYLLNMIFSFFGGGISLGNLGLIGIGIQLVIVGIAALNLILDFDFIEKASETGSAPKYMEWYASFGLMVTLVWLYVELLRLLALLSGRD